MDTGEGESVWERKREWGRERQTETERRRVVIRTTNIVSKEFSSFNERRILPPQKRSVNRAVPTTMPASQIYLTLETERRLACSPPLLAGSSGHPASGSCSEYPSEWISIWQGFGSGSGSAGSTCFWPARIRIRIRINLRIRIRIRAKR